MPLPVSPPETSTRPSPNNVAVCPDRAEFMGVVAVKAPLVSNRSALAVGPAGLEPPEIRTLPSCRSTAAAPERTSPMGFQDCQVPVGTVGTDAVKKNTHSSTRTDVVKNLLTMRKWVLRTELSVSPKQQFSGLSQRFAYGGANRGDNQATRTLAGGGPNWMGDAPVQDIPFPPLRQPNKPGAKG